jgi:tetratricopeptide (TPR) repeat protein/transglutaminase-like putative cysteine protease
MRIGAPFAFTVISLCLPPYVSAADPWDTPFARDTDHVLAAAKAVKATEGADAIVLLDEQKFAIDASGRMTTTLRKVYRVLTADGVDEWSSIEQEYTSWYQAKPQVRARVIGADGSTHLLDPKTITESPALEFDANVFSDRRVIRAPLPAIAAGAVVEYEITIKDTAPLFDAGSVQRVVIWGEEIRRFHLVLEAASAVPLKVATRLVPLDASRKSESKAGTRYEYDWGPVKAPKDAEASTPFDVTAYPVIEFSTGPSWHQIAARYSAIVDGRIAGARLEASTLAAKPGEDTKAIATRLTAALHKQVRYTGLELSDAALVPASPADVLAHQYGDCKDKATLLVAWLRAAGLKASLALLSTGTGLDVNPELPGMGRFNHAIVYVDAPEPLWIDATAQYTRVGDLPSQDQGRWALIANAETNRLSRTPEASSSANRSVHSVEFQLTDYGPGAVRETIEGSGAGETELRSEYGGADPAKFRERLEKQMKDVYLVEAVSDVSLSAGDDFSNPFRLSVAAKHAGRGVTEEDDAAVGLFTHFVFSDLPFGLLPQTGAKYSNEKPRQHDVVLWKAYTKEYRYTIRYPAFLKPKPLPKDEEVKIGPGMFRRSYRQEPGVVEAVYQFDSGPRRWTPADYDAAKAALQKVYNSKPEMIGFSVCNRGRARPWKGAGSRTDRARVRRCAPGKRIRAGAPLAGADSEEAVAAAKRAVALDAKSTQALQALGWAYQHDCFGRRFSGNWNAAEVEKAYRKAIEVDPGNLVPKVDLAIVFEHNSAGDRYGKGARLAEAIELYQGVLAKGGNAVVQQSLIIALLWAGRYEEAESEAKKLGFDGSSAALLTVIDALRNGAERAILNLQSKTADASQRWPVLLNAAVSLGQLRRYDEARELLEAARRINSSPDIERRLSALKSLKRVEDTPVSAGDPATPLLRLFLAVFRGQTDEAHVRSLLTKRDTLTKNAGAVDPQLRRLLAGIAGRLRSMGVSMEVVADFMLGGMTTEKEGDDSFGWVVQSSVANGGNLPTAFVVKEDGEYRLLATSDSLENVGRLVLDLVNAGDLKTAQRWLDVVVNKLDAGPHGDTSPAARLMWSGLSEKARTAAQTRLAAASLIATYTGSDEAIGMLKKERPAAANSLERGHIDLALCQAYLKASKWTELLASAADLGASFAVADKRFYFVVKARTGLKQWAELEKDAREELKKSPESAQALRAAILANLNAGTPKKASDYAERIGKLSFPGKDDRLLEAWQALLAGSVDARLIPLLEKERRPDNLESDIDFTLGLLHAATANPEEAQRALATALQVEAWDLVDAQAWVLQGMIQNQYGNLEAARAAYAEARQHPGDREQAAWALELVPKL